MSKSATTIAMIRRATLFLLFPFAFVASLATTTGAAAQSTRSLGPPVRAPVHRIVSLVPSATELLFALGAGDAIVAVTRYDDFPPAVQRLPRVGGLLDPDPEAIVAQHPDVVVALPNSSSRLATLARLGLPVLIVPAQTLADLWDALRRLGELTGRSAAAEAFQQTLQAALAAQQARLAEQHPQPIRALLVVGRRPLVVAGPESFLDALLAYAHGRNVVSRGGAFVVTDAEAVARWDPDVIVDMSQQGTHAQADSEAFWHHLDTIRAVHQRHIVALDDPLLVRPGPRLDQALTHLAQALWRP